MPVTVYLALGSNLGDRDQFLVRAHEALEAGGVAITQRSAVIETEPVGGPPQGKFLNEVLRGQTALSAAGLLDLTESIEHKLGRVRTVPNGPRTIDIDILLYNCLKFQSPRLTIPHPRMFERPFVMEPLKEVLDERTREFLHARFDDH